MCKAKHATKSTGTNPCYVREIIAVTKVVSQLVSQQPK